MHWEGVQQMDKSAEKKNFNLGEFYSKYGIFLIFILMAVIFSIVNHNFLSALNIRNIMRQIVVITLLACGEQFMIICGMIFRMGEYAVIKDAVYCVDFCEKTPNCTALYLLLTAQKEPEDNRRQIIDAGDRSDKTAFIEAMNSLKVLDPHWTFQIQ